MPAIERVLETALYCDDLDRAAAFYRDIMGLRILDAGPRLVAVDAGQASVLLLFKRGATLQGADLGEDGRIPSHDGNGPVHLAFAIRPEELPEWERRLREHGIVVESTVRWERGGTSLYFRDPDGHSVELATPGIWATY
ncbi:MAG: VOC family protein [Acidobacteria bacterium]|jgi:catechol 2,3-dioxygenase-like lactoylglutathione lyase family enzyme|nr:VOC family protein [Acidobacteriota bacterium]